MDRDGEEAEKYMYCNIRRSGCLINVMPIEARAGLNIRVFG